MLNWDSVRTKQAKVRTASFFLIMQSNGRKDADMENGLFTIKSIQYVG